MSDSQEPEKKEIVVGRLTGKTTIHTLQILVTNSDVGRNNYFVIYGNKDENGERKR